MKIVQNLWRNNLWIMEVSIKVGIATNIFDNLLYSRKLSVSYMFANSPLYRFMINATYDYT